MTPSYFSTLGVKPARGRAFDPDSEQPGQPPTVVISYRFWQNQLDSDPTIIGKRLRINGHACTVIGVGPRNFLGASPAVYTADLWMHYCPVTGAGLGDNPLHFNGLRPY